MRKFPIHRGLPWAFCAALLFAQSVAILHALWHAYQHVAIAEQTAHAPDPHRPDAPESAAFCSFDAVFGQLLSAAPSIQNVLAVFTGDGFPLAHRSYTLAVTDLPTPRSRGPPPFL